MSGPAHKRMRVNVAVKGHGGRIYASAAMDVNVPMTECLSYVVEPTEVVEGGREEEPRASEEVLAQEDAAEKVIMQEGADQEIEIATQRLEEEDDVPAERGEALTTEAARQYQRLWQEGWITDDMVRWRWGDQVLHKFYQARVDARVKGLTQDAEEEAMMKAVLAAEDFAGDSQRMDEASEAETEAFQAPEPCEHDRGLLPGFAVAGAGSEGLLAGGALAAVADAQGAPRGHVSEGQLAEGALAAVADAQGASRGHVLADGDVAAGSAEGSEGQVHGAEGSQLDNCCGPTLYDSRERQSGEAVCAGAANANSNVDRADRAERAERAERGAGLESPGPNDADAAGRDGE